LDETCRSTAANFFWGPILRPGRRFSRIFPEFARIIAARPEQRQLTSKKCKAAANSTEFPQLLKISLDKLDYVLIRR
jgi:hypothetical protein